MAFDSRGGRGGKGLSVLIVGTGFSGLGMAIQLKQAGFEDFTILERAGDVGGTWRDNSYPGCACDVQSHLYSYSFEPNPNWSRMFAPQPEIKAYLQHCARKYGLLPHIRYNAELVRAEYDEKDALWNVTTRAGETYSASVLVSGMGGLSTPAFPSIKGLEAFKGKMFHSAHWDHGHDLEGERVAVIGTGASAIQFVPKVAQKAARLDLYQRTATWILPKPDREISAAERLLFRRFPAAQRALRNSIYWMLESRVLGFVINPRVMKLVERQARGHIRRQVKDPVLRKKLTPDYTIGCKRILISDDFYPAVSRANVDVITDGIREIRAHSVVDVNGVEREVDTIILGTGFKAQDPMPRGAIFGRGGQDLLDAWTDGPEAYKGTTVAGFPNFYVLMGPNTGLGHSSMVYMIESQIQYVLDALQAMRRDGLRSLEVRPEAQARYNAGLQQKLGKAVWQSGCKSWYVNEAGKNTTLWPGFTFRFRELTRQVELVDYQTEPRVATAKA
ncbi:4-hydroxyacetophenone monooxygenase [Solimonas fluminis]|uniref:4-hydroxyacetophenone monooxygenase n=1 Tax=Solimonas fluminis TaxID=2086571 RepID=A0A2S5TKL1_9GAMM|nr:NAD(P)/FAD-dependent oxidoreductase [Solimonas fluminis]PPE75501.1 4-hydroxyacetophenone monooxygenase [Solimonas fluminis]